jgi:hypothetical protein
MVLQEHILLVAVVVEQQEYLVLQQVRAATVVPES